MTTMEIARELAELCRQGKNAEAMDKFYASDVVSVEAAGPPGQSPEVHGLEATRAKGAWWVDNHEVHSATVTGPWPHGNRFVIGFKYDVTFKPTGQRMMMDEVALYELRDGKIVREEFFHAM